MSKQISLTDLVNVVGIQSDVLNKDAAKMTKAFTKFESLEVN